MLGFAVWGLGFLGLHVTLLEGAQPDWGILRVQGLVGLGFRV